jgi:hypothetical protein
MRRPPAMTMGDFMLALERYAVAPWSPCRLWDFLQAWGQYQATWREAAL